MENLLYVLSIWLPRATQKELLNLALNATKKGEGLPMLEEVYTYIAHGYKLSSDGLLDAKGSATKVDVEKILREIALYYDCFL